jgi:hypothetical protein
MVVDVVVKLKANAGDVAPKTSRAKRSAVRAFGEDMFTFRTLGVMTWRRGVAAEATPY